MNKTTSTTISSLIHPRKNQTFVSLEEKFVDKDASNTFVCQILKNDSRKPSSLPGIGKDPFQESAPLGSYEDFHSGTSKHFRLVLTNVKYFNASLGFITCSQSATQVT